MTERHLVAVLKELLDEVEERTLLDGASGAIPDRQSLIYAALSVCLSVFCHLSSSMSVCLSLPVYLSVFFHLSSSMCLSVSLCLSVSIHVFLTR